MNSRKKQVQQPYLELFFNVTKANPSLQSNGIIEVAVYYEILV